MLTLVGCVPEAPAQSVKQTQADKAKAAANSITFLENAEIDNIKRRLELTADPGKIGYIVLLNEAGQPILYETVKGKVTSGGKRLTEPDRVVSYSNVNGQVWVNRAAPSDEGTYGSSNPYIFYWNAEGAYRQWAGPYLYSDRPIRLRIEPLVVNVQEKAAN